MLVVLSTEADARFIDVYNKHSPVLYGLLLRLMSTKAKADAVLIEVFEKVYRNKLYNSNTHCMASFLVRLTVITAYKRQFNTSVFLEKVNALPRLHRLLLGNINLETFAIEPSLNPGEYGREISRELKKFADSSNARHLVEQYKA